MYNFITNKRVDNEIRMFAKGVEHAQCQLLEVIRKRIPVGSDVNVVQGRKNYIGTVIDHDFEYRVFVVNKKTGKMSKVFWFDIARGAR